MIRLRRNKSLGRLYLTFLLCMVLSLAVFGYRVVTGSEITPMSDGQIIMNKKNCEFGKVYDRYNEVIAEGSTNGIIWASDQTKQAFAEILGLDIESSLNAKTTLAGNTPWLYGTEVNNFSVYALTHPGSVRQGGSVRLTISKELQEYVDAAVRKYGYENAYVVISNYQTGELLCDYGDVFKAEMHPASTLKPVLTAAALSVNEDLQNFSYNCTKSNHIFQTESGAYEIDCINGTEHGVVNLSDAMACSCNGAFITIMRSVNRTDILAELKKWGFDTSISYSSEFQLWDHTFLQGSTSDSDFLLASIGQANAYITPAGLTMCTNILLNHGDLQTPVWFTEKQISQDEKWTEVDKAGSRAVCSAEVADKVVQMMQEVTARGTGTTFWLPGFVAKTGTAQKPSTEEEDLNTVWVTGGLTNTETPYSITVSFDDVPKEVSSADAGNLAREILLHMTGGKE